MLAPVSRSRPLSLVVLAGFANRTRSVAAEPWGAPEQTPKGPSPWEAVASRKLA